MRIDKFEIPGPLRIELKIFEDNRGFFTERFKYSAFKENNLPCEFVQDSFSRSAPGVLRGLHYQYGPAQGKLVTCLSGEVFEVAVDLRKNSPHFGKFASFVMSGDRPEWFWVPQGFAHGFFVLGSKPADVQYKVDNYFSPQTDGGVRWDDPDLAIPWPNRHPILSAKDAVLPTLSEYLKNPAFTF
jgi:dTDP-4-dehydrorhamnose 3,5-epimerase